MRKKGLWSIAVAACTGVCLTAAPVFAAGEYTVTIRPGNVARFTEEFLQEYMALGAQVTEKTGSIKVKVAAGETIPMLPPPQDLVYGEEYQDRYVMNTDWYPQAEVVSGNEDLVVKYDAVTDAVEYRIRYVDSQSEEDVQTPVIAQGNIGDVVSYFPEQVENYTCSMGRQSLTLTADSRENEITFYYTSTAEPVVNEVEVPGDTITRTETVPGDTRVVSQPAGTGTGTAGTGAAGTAGTGTAGTGTAGTGTAGTGTAGTGNAGTGTQTDTTGSGTEEGTQAAGEDTEAIEGEDVPLGQQDLDGEEEEDTGDGTSKIEEEEVPLAQANLEEEGGMHTAPLIAAGVVVAAGAAGRKPETKQVSHGCFLRGCRF